MAAPATCRAANARIGRTPVALCAALYFDGIVRVPRFGAQAWLGVPTRARGFTAIDPSIFRLRLCSGLVDSV